MSMRKRMSLGGIISGKEGAERGEDISNAPRRRSSLSSPLQSWVGSGGKKINWVKRSLAAAAVAVDKAAKDLFVEFEDDQDDARNDSDEYGMLCVQRGQGQRNEFEARYRHLIETLGDLSLETLDSGALLANSRAQQDIDSMLALLKAEERQNSRAEHSRSAGGLGSDGGRGGGGSGGPGGGSDLLATPCLEFLLEERLVKVLCELGADDIPAGTMALVLGACASLLGQVCHPLLPSQAVHDPIAKLIAAAGSYGGPRGTAGGGQQQQQHQRPDNEGRSRHVEVDARAAKEKLQTNLARLLGAIWRKLREESALLDFFLREDLDGQRRSNQGTAVAGSVSYSLDVFERLLPLLELPGRAGLHAREACLVALSVKDRRVGQFVAGRTQLCAQLSRTLTARYLALYDTLEELQVAAALLPEQVQGGRREGEEGGGVGELLVGNLTQGQPERAEATFTEALSLFLQHLRFCNAVGLVASDTYACVHPPLYSPSAVGAGGDIFAKHVEDIKGSITVVRKEEEGENAVVATSLASQVRQLLLGEAIGPALSSALESRAGFAQAIAARMITELSAGVEGYGVAVAGIAACVGEEDGGGCRRQLGPLLDTVSSFLVGREGTWGTSPAVSAVDSSSTRKRGGSAASCNDKTAAPLGSMVVLTSTSSASVSLRDVLLRRIRSSCPSLRVSTLELVASLSELRDDRVLLDLAVRPEDSAWSTPAMATNDSSRAGEKSLRRATPPTGTAASGELEDEASRAEGGSVQALLDNAFSTDEALRGLRVSPAMVDSFGAAFAGSPIHPNFRRFASHVSLEGYLVEAHQRQIQQLMEGARTSCHSDDGDTDEEEDEKVVMVGDAGELMGERGNGSGGSAVHNAREERGPEGVGEVVVPMEQKLQAAAESATGHVTVSKASSVTGGEVEGAFDTAGFVREHGQTLAAAADVEGSFVHALFCCLEAVFERTLEENVATTGVLSSLCLAATATEVSPVRRLLLVLLFDSTKDAPFRSMRRILEKLWASAQARVASLPNAPRLLATTRASLGMVATEDLAGPGPEQHGDDDEEEVEVAGIGPRQGSRGMREELKKPRKAPTDGGGGGGGVNGSGGEGRAGVKGGEGRDVHLDHEQQEQMRFLETYVFLEEFLKELFCALSAKSHVESDKQGLTESHRRGSQELIRGVNVEDGEASPMPARFGAGMGGRRLSEEGWLQLEDGGGPVEHEELPTSLDEFLREAAFPTLVSPPVL